MNLRGDCEIDIRNAMSKYADLACVTLSVRHRRQRSTLEFRCVNPQCNFHMVFKQACNDIWKVNVNSCNAHHVAPTAECQIQRRKRSKHPYCNKQLEEIIVEMFKLHPKSSARQIAVAVQNKLKCTTTIPVSMIKHIRTTLWQKSVENAKHALKTLPQLVLKYNHCDNDNVMTIKTHTVENGDVQYDGVFCIPGQSMRISKSGVIRMLGAMDAAHCTFPLTRGILIDFGMYGPGKEIIPIAFAHYCGNEDRECYEWFIGNCCRHLPHLFGRESRMVIITDGKKEIATVLKSKAPTLCHRLCYQHLLGTLLRKCSHSNKKKVKSCFGSAVYATTVKRREDSLDMLRQSDPKIRQYMVTVNVKSWTLTGDGNCSYGYVSSQLAESFHSAACNARQLHPVAMIEALVHTSDNWIKKHQDTYNKLQNCGIKLPSHVSKHIDNMSLEAADYEFKSVAMQIATNIVIQGNVKHKLAINWHATCVIVRSDNSTHSTSVASPCNMPQGNEDTHVQEAACSMCTCGYPSVYHMPCKHQVALLLHKEKMHHVCDLVDPLLTVKAGHMLFNQAGIPGLYATVNMPITTPLVMPSVRRPPGRPRRKRIKSKTMPEDGNGHNNKKVRLCSLCHKRGHNRRKCTSPILQTQSLCMHTTTQSEQTTTSN